MAPFASARFPRRPRNRPSRPGTSSRAPRRPLGLEPLERRDLLTVFDLVISEIMYNPRGQTGFDNNDFEYIEIYNTSDVAQSLAGLSFTTGISYPFPATGPNSTIGPNGYYVIVRNATAFTVRYPGVPINGTFSGSLDNTGEKLTLSLNTSVTVAEVSYSDVLPWSSRADGGGSSLQVIDPLALATERYSASNWTASGEVDGSPGGPGTVVQSPIVINEILSNSDDLLGEDDYIELYNLSDNAVDIGGWYLSDSFAAKYQIAAGTTVPARGYRVFYENQFNAGPNAFALSSNGERANLLQVVGGKTLFVDSVDFAASLTSVSLGRLPNGQGLVFPQTTQTPGAENSSHHTSQLVVSEVMYNPIGSNNDDLEYIEIFNRGPSQINLSTTATSGWRIRGVVDFNFPTSPATTLNAGQRMVVLRFNPSSALPDDVAKKAAFEARYGVRLNSGTGTVIKAVGGYGGTANDKSLDNRSGRIELQELTDIDNTAGVSYQFVQRDLVYYEDRNGWPGRPDGNGSSLERIDPLYYGNDSESWRSSYQYNGSPGQAENPTQTVVVNEVVSHTDPPQYDSIELYNRSAITVDISGWFLTDDLATLNKFTIPSNTFLGPGQYITFNADPGLAVRLPFNLDGDNGDGVWLIQTAGGVPFRFADNVSFDAAFNVLTHHYTFGRWPNGTGALLPIYTPDPLATLAPFLPGTFPTIPYSSGANAGPWIDDVVISEVMYNPGAIEYADDLEFVELYNRTPVALSLGPIEDAGWPDNPRLPEGWRLRKSVDFDFTDDHVIPGNGTIVVVGFDPADAEKLNRFRTHYGLGPSFMPVGPFNLGSFLSDSGGDIQLERPDMARTVLPDPDKFTPNVPVDYVAFNDTAPWPTSPDGGGHSLHRISPDLYANDVTNWTADDPTPGSVPYSTGNGPRVAGVRLWSSGWTTSFRNAISAGSAAPGYAIPTGATQFNALPWAALDRISVTFDSDAAVAPDALVLRGVNVLQYPVGSLASYDPATRTATWTLTQPPVNDRLSITLDDAKVTGGGSMPLDGEWTDLTSTFNSGNGVPGGDFVFRFNVLVADADGDGEVRDNDYRGVRASMFTRIGTPPYDLRRDLNGDGAISPYDLVLARNHRPSELPSGTPGSPAASPLPPDDADDELVGGALTAVRRTGSRPVEAAVDAVLAGDAGDGLMSAVRRVVRVRRRAAGD